MSRTLSSAALSAFYSEETGDFPIILITIVAAGVVNPIRVSSDPTQRVLETTADVFYGTVSRGETYYFIPFSITLPNDNDTTPPQTSITIDNVSRELMSFIRNLTSRPTATIEVVMSNTPDTVEVEFPEFDIETIGYDQLQITGELKVDMLVTEPFPAGTFTPAQFPGLF